MFSKIYSTEINYLQVLDENGELDKTLLPAGIDNNMLIEMYKGMSLARAFDAKVLSLQRQGRAVTYAPLLGEEATQIGSAMAMRKNDLFVPAFRQHAVYIARGTPLHLLFLYWKGYEEGDVIPNEVGGTPIIVPVSTQLPHAAGIAFAQKYKGTGNSVVTYVGDGGTSEGDFYEALNFAGVWKIPLIVIIENNGWAISIPRSKQTAAKTLAQKAVEAGINAIQVDGNDVLGVYKATRDAIENSAQGPTVIECLTYRMGLHTTADDPTKYRSDADLEEWKRKDPLLRLKTYLVKNNLWDDGKEKEMADEQAGRIDKAVEEAEKFVPDPKSMFEHVYSFMPEILKQELDESEAAGFWQG